VSEVLTPDLCVIGAGSAGLSVAAIGASLGAAMVLIERGRMGGDCLNVGCVPSKALIAAGDRAQAIRTAGAFGIEAGEPAVDFARVRDHIAAVIAGIAPHDSAERFTGLGVRVIGAQARFTDPRDGRGRRCHDPRPPLRDRHRLGAAVPPVPGLDRVPFLTNETVFDLAERPAHLIVLGGGPVGVEIAQAHRRLGAAVTILEAGPRLLARDDPELAGVVAGGARRRGGSRSGPGSRPRRWSRPRRAARTRSGSFWPTGRRFAGSHLLVATGRRPVTEGLGLEAAGVAVDRSGIVVDASLRTANRRVYAIGDCAGGAAAGLRFTHVANYHAGLVIRNALFRLPVRVDAAAIPRVTYTDPELAAVGLSEEEATARHGAVRVLRWPVAENDRARAERATRGLVKAVVTPRGRILGCAIAAPGAGDLIVPWALCIAKGLKVRISPVSSSPIRPCPRSRSGPRWSTCAGRPETPGCGASSPSCGPWAER
jgi:pyruvate/2-oxoglutarate dehydrogenase complex dihydrolipoamide dehydrogenase (E3) component